MTRGISGNAFALKPRLRKQFLEILRSSNAPIQTQIKQISTVEVFFTSLFGYESVSTRRGPETRVLIVKNMTGSQASCSCPC